MSLKEDLEIFDPAKSVQEAYDKSVSNEFNGEVLEPWTIARESAAMILGVRILNDFALVKRFVERGKYANELHDFIVVVWLLHQDSKKVVQVIRGSDIKAESFIEEAYAWAEEIGFRPGSEYYKAAGTIIGKITVEKIRSYFESTSKISEVKKKLSTLQVGKSN